MKTWKKAGLTALAGSLVATSAFAGAMTVSGSANLTYTGNTGAQDSSTAAGKTNGQDGSRWGMTKTISFAGSGEMDNGWTVSAATAFTDAGAFSTSSVAVTMGSIGTISSGNSFGGHAGSYDGLAGAYEEVDDGGTTSLSNNLIGSTVDNAGIRIPMADRQSKIMIVRKSTGVYQPI